MKKIEERQAVIDRLNPNNTPYMHTFDAETGECTDCHRHLTDETFEDEQGKLRIHMWCPVIGTDEVAKFRDYEER